jgi:hypothetical protein
VSAEPRKQSGVSITTLVIAAAASATAALVVPMFWEPGTVFAAAMTPIIVSIVSELLKHPTEKVTAVTSRRTTGGAVVFEPPPEEPFDPLAPAPIEELEALPQTTTQRAVHKRRGLTGRQWRLALVTGLVAFVAAVAFVTVSELVAGESVGSDSNPTTFFGRKAKNDATPTPTPTATPSETPTETPTPGASTTPTPTPTETPTPAPTTTPEPAAPAPQSAPSASPTATP